MTREIRSSVNNIQCLDTTYSTTRQVTKEKPVVEKQVGDEFESVLFLPEGEGRQGKGGLRTQGYFKTSLKDKPVITVITVVFNGEQYLEETILSVINQTYDNVEYIIIDGGSTDRTLEIIRKYEHAIDYWVSEKDKGIYDAFNKAICLTSGEYYIVLGCDDLLFIDAIKNLVDSNDGLQGSEVDYVVAAMYLGEKLRSGMNPKLAWLGAHSMVSGHSVGLLIRTSVHLTLGLYSTRYKLASDALFIKHLFASKFKGIESDIVMGKFSVEGASNSNIALGLCEGFLVQYETERIKIFQILLFIARLLKNLKRLW